MTERTITQDHVNEVWDTEWHRGGYTAKSLFAQRLFVEGYPVVRKHIPQSTARILDVGAATGRYSVKFAQDFPNAEVYATDILDSSLEVVRALVAETGVTNVKVQKEDASKLSFPDNYFDVVYSGMVLQILPDVDTAVKEMRRVLKPGGILIMTTVNYWNFHSIFKWYLKAFNRPPEYYGTEVARSQKELRTLFTRAGFTVVDFDGFYPAYGIFRLKMYWKPAALIGRVLNRVSKMIDAVTGRFLSRHFGFEIFAVAEKPRGE